MKNDTILLIPLSCKLCGQRIYEDEDSVFEIHVKGVRENVCESCAIPDSSAWAAFEMVRGCPNCGSTALVAADGCDWCCEDCYTDEENPLAFFDSQDCRPVYRLRKDLGK